MDKIAELTKMIRDSHNIVFFGGAGVSTESGLPDFRSHDGLYGENLGINYHFSTESGKLVPKNKACHSRLKYDF